MKKILLIISLIFVSFIYAQQQQEVSPLRLDSDITVYYDEMLTIRKHEEAYDVNGNQTLYISYYRDATTQSFVPLYKYESTYDARGNLTLNNGYSWDTTTQSFVPSDKYEYTYNSNRYPTLVIANSWDNTTQSFVLRDKYENTFDANGNPTLGINYSWNSTTQTFVPSYKSIYIVDAKGNLTLETSYYWDTTTKSYVPSNKYEYAYDGSGNQTLYRQYCWDTTSKSYVSCHKYEYAYDANGNKTLKIYYSSWNTTQSLVPEFKEIRTYSDGLFMNLLTQIMDYKWYPELGIYKPSFKTEYETILDTDNQLHRMGVSYQYDTNFNVWEKIDGEEFKSYEYYTKTASLSTQTVENDLLSLYPNPTSQVLYVSHPELNLLGIQIVDLNGKQMYSGTIQKNVPLDVSTYTPGMYLVTIKNKETNKKNTYKIIKK